MRHMLAVNQPANGFEEALFSKAAERDSKAALGMQMVKAAEIDSKAAL